MKGKVISIILAVLLAITAVALVAVLVSPAPKQEESKVAVSDEGFISEGKVYEMPRTMSFSAYSLEKSATNSVSVNVKATVYPENAPNKKVDWTVEWADSANTSNVSDYLTVVPEGDGSANAVITCYQPFSGEIIVSVITREGKLTDSCVVTFAGKPSELAIEGTGLSTGTGSFGSYINLGSGNTYNFNIVPSNVFGQVGAECNYTYTLTGYGSIVTKDNNMNANTDEVTWIDGTEETVNINDITTVSPFYSSMFDISISGNTLSIKPNCSLENYLTAQTRVSSSKFFYDNEFFKYSNDNWYYELTVTETNTGISNSIKIRPVQSVTGVSLNLSDYVF